MSLPVLVRYAIILAFFGYGLVRWLKVRSRERAAENWPSVEGLSQGGRVAVGSQPNHPLAELDYSYSVNGEYYAGQILRGPFRNADEAQEFIDGGKGRKLIVRYDPSKFEKSIVRDEDQPSTAAQAG